MCSTNNCTLGKTEIQQNIQNTSALSFGRTTKNVNMKISFFIILTWLQFQHFTTFDFISVAYLIINTLTMFNILITSFLEVNKKQSGTCVSAFVFSIHPSVQTIRECSFVVTSVLFILGHFLGKKWKVSNLYINIGLRMPLNVSVCPLINERRLC